MGAYCLAMRGRVHLARGETAKARHEDAAPAIRLAHDAREPQMLYPALALGARAEAAADSRDTAQALADELLLEWASNVDAYPVSSWAVDLVCALDALERTAEFLETAGTVRIKTRWLEAVVSFASADHVAAAEQFREIGSLPDEALARLRAAKSLSEAGRAREAQSQLRRAVAFYRRAGAELHLREAASLAGESIASASPSP